MATGFNIHDQWLGDVMPQSGVSVAIGRNTADGQLAVPVTEVNAQLAILHDTLGSGIISYNSDDLRLELIPTGPTPSGTQSIVTAICFDSYDAIGGQSVTGTPIDVVMKATRYNSHPEIFVQAFTGDELNINMAGVYEIEYKVSVNQTSGSTRMVATSVLQRKAPGGAFTMVGGTQASSYHRMGSIGEGTSNSKCILSDVVAGEIIKVTTAANGTSPAGVVTLANGTSLTVRKLA